MGFFHAIALGVLQGATEFIPVSSSGHLVLVPWLLGWAVPGLAFDATVHWGTLLALAVYFWGDLRGLAVGWVRSLFTRQMTQKARLAWLILVGTVPAVLAGTLAGDFFEGLFSAPRTVALLLMVTAFILALSEWFGRFRRKSGSLSPGEAFLIGVGQALAIAPGISRSGATIAAGVLLGLKRDEAARFSFLLSFPVILGAGVLELGKLWRSGSLSGSWQLLAVGFVAAAVSGYVSIAFLLSFLRRRRLYVFALYCLALGLVGLLSGV